MPETMTDAPGTGRDLAEWGLSPTPLNESQAAAFLQAVETWRLASQDDPNGRETESAAINRFLTIFLLLWGKRGERMLHPPEERPEETPANSTADLEAGYEEAEATMMSVSLPQATPKQLQARVRRLFTTGRCSKKHFVQMSLMPSRVVRGVLASNEAVPAGTYHDANELSEAHARRVADWACGRKSK